MNKRIKTLIEQADIKFEAHHQHQGIDTAVVIQSDLAKFAELVWKAAYEEGHDVGVDAGFEAGRNASLTEQKFGVEE